MKKFIKEYYEQWNTNNSDNLDEMDKLLERHRVKNITDTKTRQGHHK